MRVIRIKTEGFDPFIDFLKGVCIMMVVIKHSTPLIYQSQWIYPLWVDCLVPLFLLLQSFHFFKKADVEGLNHFCFRKVWKRVLRPFITIECVIVLLYIIGSFVLNSDVSMAQIIKNVIIQMGLGPGSYFPWIYLQFAMMLPIIYSLKKKLSDFGLFVVMVLISQGLEMFSSLFLIQYPFVYRVLFIRYFFIIYMGYILASKGFVINMRTAVLSIGSLFCILCFNYIDIDLKPLFYSGPGTVGWKSCHWVCYFYIGYLLLYLIKQLFIMLRKMMIVDYICAMGKFSYEFFLFQMLYFALLYMLIPNYFQWISSNMLLSILNILVSMTVCVASVLIYKRSLFVLKRD